MKALLLHVVVFYFLSFFFFYQFLLFCFCKWSNILANLWFFYIYIYTDGEIVKYVRFYFMFHEICSLRPLSVNQNAVKTVILWNITIWNFIMFIYFKLSFIPVIKTECSQSSVSHDPSEISLMWWFFC